ncbi:aminotransferase class IV [Salegentibacter salegens]|uniref:D-alanine transaminase n=1 Tax=Salegentibacter salegens TaxID=143223 RepID=A0A1M7K4P2_9FLAO|nr:aminotransferase class IV [Salegentibacter salegens]PRX43113.1 D-alanine transaminase [Salegentibacter salegens]SHM60272.1 D-alanine transaminase [Salegentibacter salegens]
MKPEKQYPSEVYLNGKWLKHDEAFVSVFDRAFMFGDGIYEVTPFYSGKPFLLKEHLKRLKYCLDEIQIKFDPFALQETMLEAISRAGLNEADAAVYIQVSRGAATRSHFVPEKIETTVLLYAFPVTLKGFEKKSWEVMATEDKRWHRCDIKSTALLANVMANEEAIAAGFAENLLVRKGYFTEGSHSSLFFVKYGVVHTHPEGQKILSGITRAEVINICTDLNIKVVEKAVHIDELVEVEEIFVTGTTTQIIPISSITHKNKKVYTARKDSVTKKLQEIFIKRTREKLT